MAEGIIMDTIIELFGGEFFTNEEHQGGADWSPNNYKELYISPTVVAVRYHVPPKELKARGLDFNVRQITDPDILDGHEIEEIVQTRNLGCLEGIFVSSDLGGAGVAKNFADKVAQSVNNRIHQYGVAVPGQGEGGLPFKVTGIAEIEGSEGWQERANLQPQHYEMDAEGGALWSALQPVEEVEDDGDSLRAEVEGYYTDAINGTINKILREYGKIFSSGYEVLKPSGVLLENSRGRGVLGRIKGTQLVKDNVERNLQFFYDKVKSLMQITEVPVRSTEEIASVVISGKTTGGDAYSGSLHFPYKMMEYAFGQKFRASGEKDLTLYEGHDARKSWEDYSNNVVRASLKDVLTKLVWHSLVGAGIAEDYDGAEANRIAQEKLDKMQIALCTSILVSKFDVTDNELVAIKVRILDPMNTLPRNQNLLYQTLLESIGDLEGSDDLNVYPVESDGYFVEYQVELQKRLAGAEPLFAYKALEKILEQGKTLSFNDLIIGKDPNDRIIRNGGQISFKNKLSHLVVAGSRAGKGVWTFAPVAGAIVEAKPIFYQDNKPDMASWFKRYSDNCFVLNGHSLISGDGNDHFEQFLDADNWIDQSKIPEYVAPMLEAAPGNVGYKDLGAFIYTRGLTLLMGIMGSRVEVPSKLDKLGGPGGVVFVIDELANASNGLMARLGMLNTKIANTAYYTKLQAQWEAEESGEPVKKIDVDKPGMDGYWFTQFYYSLKSTIERMQSLSNAGLKNVESSRSDIFVLTQQPPEMVDSLSEVGDMFGKRNKNSMGVAGKIDDPRILPSMALVGGTDIFLGYDRDNGEFLAQRDKRSKAYQYLNEITRGFGYLPLYNSKTRDKVGTIAEADKACYYKPFLIFAEHSKDDYFAANALKYAAAVGVPEAHGIPGGAIIDRNINEAGNDFHEGVGLMGYLNMAGVSEDQVRASLNQSGDIADYVVKAMGYPDQGPGTWMKFLMDMRPEWIFSAGDVIDSLKNNSTLLDTVEKRMPEFTGVYPEAFFSLGDPDYSGNEGGEGLFGGEGLYGYEHDAGVGEEEEAQPEFAYQGDEDELFDTGELDELVTRVSSEGTEPFQVFEDNFGTESQRPDNHGFDTFDVGGSGVPFTAPDFTNVPPINPDVSASVVGGYQSFETSIPGEYEPGKFRYSDGQERSTEVDWTSSGAVQTFISFLERAGIVQRLRPPHYGHGVYVAPDGTADNFDSGVAPVDIDMGGSKFDMREPVTVGALMQQITDGAIRLVGGADQVKSVRVIAGTLVVNNTAYKPKFAPDYLNSMPADFRNEVATGDVARLFNWGVLNTFPELRRLAFDDVNFVVDYVTGPLGWRSKVSVDRFFQRFSGLDSLTLDGEIYTRRDYRARMTENDVFYAPTRAWHMSNAVDRAFSKGTSNSWNYTKSTLSRHDIGYGRKIFLGGAGIVGSAVMGGATVASKAGRGTAKGIGSIVRSIGKAVRDSNEM